MMVLSLGMAIMRMRMLMMRRRRRRMMGMMRMMRRRRMTMRLRLRMWMGRCVASRGGRGGGAHNLHIARHCKMRCKAGGPGAHRIQNIDVLLLQGP